LIEHKPGVDYNGLYEENDRRQKLKSCGHSYSSCKIKRTI